MKPRTIQDLHLEALKAENAKLRRSRKPIKEMINRLEDLKKQATVERSHFYTGKVITDAIALFYDLLSHTPEE